MTGLSSSIRPLAMSMAHRRAASRDRNRLLVAAVLMTALMAAGIRLGNEVTGLRREVQDLARTCHNLDARGAMLAVRWNTESSRQTIMRRAQRELGLVSETAPGAILVSYRDAGAGTGTRPWRRLAAHDPVPTASAAQERR